MIEVEIAALPNQTLSIQLAERQYVIGLREANGVMAISVQRDGVDVVRNTRLLPGVPVLPYRYQEDGNFLMTTEGDVLPYYDQFGVTQFLVYLTADEVAALRAA